MADILIKCVVSIGFEQCVNDNNLTENIRFNWHFMYINVCFVWQMCYPPPPPALTFLFILFVMLSLALSLCVYVKYLLYTYGIKTQCALHIYPRHFLYTYIKYSVLYLSTLILLISISYSLCFLFFVFSIQFSIWNASHSIIRINNNKKTKHTHSQTK